MAQRAAVPEPTIYVVDADSAVRDALCTLLTQHGFRVESFASAADFLDGPQPAGEACVITEVHLPDRSGLQLIEELRARGLDLPVIVIAGRGDVPTAVRAIRSGAVDFLEKPFLDRSLLERVRELIGAEGRRSAPGRP